jgi:hypothetical protein
MPLFLSLVLSLGGRALLFLFWLFDAARFAHIYSTFIGAFIGFLAIPWTMFFYTLVWQATKEPSGAAWSLVVFGFILDVVSYIGMLYGAKQAREGN